jgi:hypothetical protein
MEPTAAAVALRLFPFPAWKKKITSSSLSVYDFFSVRMYYCFK